MQLRRRKKQTKDWNPDSLDHLRRDCFEEERENLSKNICQMLLLFLNFIASVFLWYLLLC